MLAFHPAITLAAFLLAWASTVVPAWVAAKRKLRDKPASLLRAFHVCVQLVVAGVVTMIFRV